MIMGKPIKVSFRDPDGFIIKLEDSFYRVVLKTYSEDLSCIEKSEVLATLSVIKHEKISPDAYPVELRAWLEENDNRNILCIFKLQTIEIITYPWEWTPEMLTEAALLTLKTLKTLVQYNLTLKDASFFNIQFINGVPYFIDLLSIKKTKKFYPWYAFGQFLQHFTFPAIIFKYGVFSNASFLQAFPEGINKKSASRLTPLKSYFNIFELLNVHLLSKISDKNTLSISKISDERKEKIKLLQLVDFIENYHSSIKFKKENQNHFQWENYYSKDVESVYYSHKKTVLLEYLNLCENEDAVLDLGCNTGEFTSLLTEYFSKIIAIEKDTKSCNVIREKLAANCNICNHWAVINSDLINPSPAIGWHNRERYSLLERVKSPVVVCLALIHHIYFKGSIGMLEIAELLNNLTIRFLIIEFIDVGDDKIQLLAMQNNTRLSDYNLDNFISSLKVYFELKNETQLSDYRYLYLFKKKN